MIKLYYGSNIDAVYWKIYTDKLASETYSFPEGTTSMQVADKLCQFCLFDLDEPKTNVVNISKWKLTDDSVKENITSLANIDAEIIFALEASAVKNKIFTELKIETVKCTAVTRRSKQQLIHLLLTKAKITLKPEIEEALVDLLPEKINFIKNEINKLELTGKNTFTLEEIKLLVFNTGEDDVFNVINCWLEGDLEKTTLKIQDLLAANYTIQDIVPIFVFKLVQLKFYLEAKLARWTSEMITAKQAIPFWQQNKYANLKPYDKKLDKVNDMLSKLYKFDINIKTSKSIPYAEFIRILFE